MNTDYRVINNELAGKIIHEYAAFIKETRKKIDETRRATMVSLKKLLKLKDGEVVEINEDDSFKIITGEAIDG
jgi:hypothetical protein